MVYSSNHQRHARRGERRIQLAAMALAAIAALTFVAVAATASEARQVERPDALRTVIGASSGEHLWFVVPSERDPEWWRLLHHAREMPGPYYSPQAISLPREPAAMAAFGTRVWLIFSPRTGERRQFRSVNTVAVDRDPGLGIYRPVPRDRMETLEALPAEGRLVSVTATDRGPAVLIVPRNDGPANPRGGARGANQRDSQSDSRDLEGADEEYLIDEEPAEELAEAARWRPLLLQMRTKRWQEIELPEDAHLTPVSQLAAAGREGYDRSQLVLLTVDPADESRTIMYRHVVADGNELNDSPQWEQVPLELDLRRVLAIETVRGRLLAIMQDNPGERPQLRYLRPPRTLDLGEVPEPRGRWNVFGMTDKLRMIEYSTRDGAMMRRINAVTGEASEPEEMNVQPLPAGRLWYTSLLLLAAAVAVLLVFLVRPSRQEKVELPKGVGVMPPIPRLLALLMDLFPGGVVSVLVFRVSPIEVLRLPIMTDSLELAAPFLLMVAVMFVHTTLTEMIKGTSLGKALLGARVISTGGDRPAAKQVLIRNAVKVLILLVPVLAIFALLNPNLRGFNDLLAQSVVVGDVHDPSQGDESGPEKSS